MQCRDVRNLADSFVSGELLTETNHEILRHLETCPECRAEVDARRALRAAVRRAFENAPGLGPSPEFAASLRTALQRRASTTDTRRFGLREWGAIAAMLLVAVALGVMFGGRWIGGIGSLARAAVGDHRNCALKFRLAEKPISLDEAARQYDSAYRILETLPPADLMTEGGAAHVLERHACVYGGRRFAHIVLQYRGAPVSLLVTALDQDSPRVLGIFPGRALMGSSTGHVEDTAVVSVRTAHHMVFFVGDLPLSDLVKLADAAAEPLSRQLNGV
jgi:hypothetical protein